MLRRLPILLPLLVACACGSAPEPPLAEPAEETGASQELELTLYELGWTLYKLGRYDEAIQRFAELLDLEATSAEPEPPTLRDEAIDQIVIILLDEDWDGDGALDDDDGPARLDDLRLQRPGRSWLDEVCRRLGEMYTEMGQRDLAARVLTTCKDR